VIENSFDGKSLAEMNAQRSADYRKMKEESPEELERLKQVAYERRQNREPPTANENKRATVKKTKKIIKMVQTEVLSNLSLHTCLT
jgi:hypothetical protein